MAIGRISGPMLFSNLERQGVDLAFQSNLLYVDVNNLRVGIINDSPQYSLDASGNVKLSKIIIEGNTITANSGKVDLGSTSNFTISGGSLNYVLSTDGSGNLTWNEVSSLDIQWGNILLANNTISIATLNGNLYLEANGAGNVVTTNDFYAGNVYALNISGNVSSNGGAFTGNVIAPYFLGNLEGTTAQINDVQTATGNASVWYATNLNSTNGNITTLVVDNFSTANAVISGGYISDLSNITVTTGNIDTLNTATGNITNLTGTSVNVGYTTTTELNTTTGNITNLTGLTVNVAETTTTVINSTTGNITTGTIDTLNTATGNITNLTGTSVNVGYTTTTELNTTSGNITNLTGLTVNVAETTTTVINSTTGNITNGNSETWYTTNLNSTDGNIITLVATNFSTANTLISGGVIGNVDIQANNFSTGNAVISGGYISALSNIEVTTGNTQSWYSTDLNSTNGNITTLVVENFSTANAQITGGNVTANISGNVTGSFSSFSGNVNADWFIGNIDGTVANFSDVVYANSDLTVAGNLIASGNVIARKITSPSGDLHISAATNDPNNIIRFDSVSAFDIPSGTTDQRPPTPDYGYVRYNIDQGSIEWWGGASWVQGTQTVTSENITPDGATDTYTLAQSTSDNAILVNINGTIQQAGAGAYTVVGDQITFAEIPLTTDIIEVRYLAGGVAIANYGNTQVGAYLTTNTGNISAGNIATTGNTTINGNLNLASNPGTPGNTSTPASWIKVYVGNVEYFMPLYQ